MIAKCPKCGADDLQVRLVNKNELIDSSSIKKVDDEFISSSEYDYFYKLKAKKEHLKLNCRCCQYIWRSDILGEAPK